LSRTSPPRTTEFASASEPLQAVAGRIHPNTLRFYTLPQDARPSLVDPVSLLSSRRLDVMARVLYARARREGYGLEWGRHAYENLIRAWTHDFTPPREVEPGRFSMADYYEQFDRVLDSMAARRFSAEVSIIPTCQDTIVDGAHRLAAAIVLGLDEVVCVELDGAPQVQDHRVLQQIGMEQAVIEDLVLELVRRKPDTRLAMLFPCAHAQHDRACERLGQAYLVDYQHEFAPTYSGLMRLMDLCYGGHDWWAQVHAERFASRRFRRFAPLRLVFYQEKDQPVRPVKEEIRGMLGAGVDGIHTTDTHAETVAIAEIVLNANGRKWLNHARQYPTPRFEEFFEELRANVQSSGAADRICIDSGGVLAAYGLRDVTDLDYLEVGGTGTFDRDGMINCHNGEYKNTGIDEEAIVCDPRNYFYYQGIKFAAPHVVRRLKLSRGSGKDLDDVARLDAIGRRSPFNVPLKIRKTRTMLKSAATAAKMAIIVGAAGLLKRVIPPKHHHHMRAAYRRWFARDR
jgi:hypothetical protein